MNNITITRRSPFTGKFHQMEIPLTPKEYGKRATLWQTGMLIQDAFPTLDANQREFIKTGITPQEWEDTFGNEE